MWPFVQGLCKDAAGLPPRWNGFGLKVAASSGIRWKSRWMQTGIQKPKCGQVVIRSRMAGRETGYQGTLSIEPMGWLPGGVLYMRLFAA